ncbi:MAG: helix-hairpin-helix domain-containing protein [Phycisphaerae bacterium]
MSKPSGSSPEDPSASAQASTWGWTRPHRFALYFLLILLLGFLTLQYLRRPYRLDEPLTLEHGELPLVESAIDPNSADAARLACLPHLSEKLARAIVAYRQLHHDASGVAFATGEDLERVPGIGKKVRLAILPYLCFPGDATRPAASPNGLLPPKMVGESEER